MIKNIIKGIQIGLGILLSLFMGGYFLLYAFTDLDTIVSGDPLSFSLMQGMLDKLKGISYDTGTNTLELKGKLKLVDNITDATCDSSTRGEILFSGDNIVSCNGTGWVLWGEGVSSTPTIGTQINPGASCKDILEKGGSGGSGIYRLSHSGVAPYAVYCDMEFEGGGWTLVQVTATLANGRKFSGSGSCQAVSDPCDSVVKSALASDSSQVMFYTDENLRSILNYSSGGLWHKAMINDSGRGASAVSGGLSVVSQGSSVDTSRNTYWSSFWDSGTGIIFSNGSHYGILALQYGTNNNGWHPNAPGGGNTHTINVFIR